MTPLPKRKVSKGRRDRRRAHDSLQVRNTATCSNCGQTRLPHRACPNCGHYKGREVIKVERD
ncbi:MAG: 50S ribosomal protein L32 [Anaerolineales bacterium]|nr:50S ribosomal protein L32 [Anaerolineales bacterium]MCW5856248.1 50S ribosomal protein L32 [Anaerolineales bacterium]